jgi:outer membrane protein
MKIIVKSLFALSVLGSTVVHAAGYGVVDLERIVEQSAYLKQQNMSFQQQIKPQTTQIESLSKELEAMQLKAQQSANKLSDAEKQKLAQQYQTKLSTLNTLQQKVQATVQSNIQSINQVMDSRIKQAAEQLRKENNLDVVLNKNSALAYDAKYDLTDKMIQKVNAIK